MKNKILVIFMAFALTLPVYSIQEEEVLPVDNTQTEQIVADEQSGQEVKEPEENDINNALRKPTSKKKIAKKFMLAMLGVIISSTLIFALLSVYNKLRECFNIETINPKEEPSSLETPDNLNDAVKSFLDRTHWDN